MNNIKCLCGTLLLLASLFSLNAQVWQDPHASTNARVEDLLSQMTLEEKISYCGSIIPAIERLGIPEFEWYGEALHGIIAWNCTQFPQNIAMGCTWDPDLMFDVATAISNEARALKNIGQKEVMMFSPTVNMARDPRWGRNEECYSEDPFLMSEIARMYVRGMEGNDSTYLKTVTTVKHFVANNVDKNREYIHSHINKKDLYEYYFPAYKTCIVDEKASGIMTALNGLNGVPCSANDWLVNGVLRKEWGFKGYVIADWAAVGGLETNMKVAASQAEAAAMAIQAGVDQECFRNKDRFAPMVNALGLAIEQGLLTETELDTTVARLLRLRFMTGDFDNPNLNPYSHIPASVLECETHTALALKAAEKAIVLLKNDDILPLTVDSSQTLAVIGPFAKRCWMGIYSGFPKSKVSPLDGIKNCTNAQVKYAEGCAVTTDSLDEQKIQNAVALAQKSDYVVLVVGNDESTATENLDRTSLALPGHQHQLIRAVQAVNKNVILVLIPSGPTTIPWEQEHLPGIICTWPNGQEQGTALAKVLFGKVNPGGKLNSTWYASDDDLPPFHDYNIQTGRTYMYFDGQPLYPFGYGLSYTLFNIKNVSVSTKELNAQEALTVSAQVSNQGAYHGDEVVQVYVRHLNAKLRTPHKALKGFKRVHVSIGQSQDLNITLPYEAFAYYDTTQHTFRVDEGEYEILVGNSSENIVASHTIHIQGDSIPHIKVGQKSGYFNALDENRTKRWDYLYDKSSELQLQEEQAMDSSVWVEYEIIFSDPGFYVNTWDAVLNIKSARKGSLIETSMAGAKIDSYMVDGKQKLPITIPIPPEYDKAVSIRITTLKGEVQLQSIRIIPPGNEKSFVVDRIYKASE